MNHERIKVRKKIKTKKNERENYLIDFVLHILSLRTKRRKKMKSK